MFRPAYSNSDRTLSCQNRFSPVIMSQEDVASGRPSHWPELYICGDVVNLSPGLFTDPFIHLTTLSIQKNSIVQIPPEIRNLVNLQTLNASHNKISSIPKELGDLIELRRLLLARNRITMLPAELGKLYNIQEIDLHNNPLSHDICKVYHGPNATHKLQIHLLNLCTRPCLITSRNCGKKVNNINYQYRHHPNAFYYNQWYTSISNLPPPTTYAVTTTPAYQTESLEHQFSRLAIQKHGIPLVLTQPPFVNSQNVCWRPPRHNSNNRLARKKKPVAIVPQLTDVNSLLLHDGSHYLPRLVKRKKRKKRDKATAANKSKMVLEEDRSHDFLTEITSVNDIDLSMVTDTSSTSSNVSCQCCFCDPSGQIWNVEQFLIASPLSKPKLSTPSSSSESSTNSSLKDFETVEQDRRRHFEVSSQIITAPNGHKDLEIRFSTTTNSSATADDLINIKSDITTNIWALNWHYRQERILNEIYNNPADIICLQEVEWEQYCVLFNPYLQQNGYTGIYSPKSRAKTMVESERKYVDGCAIFFKNSKFSLVKENLIEFNQLAMNNNEGVAHMLNRVMTKDNIGLAAVLQTVPSDVPGSHFSIPQPIIVCNAHIHWDPEYCDVKLIQAMMLTSELYRMIEETKRLYDMARCEDVHVLIAGDFNSLPDSGVIEFLSRGRVPQDHPDFKQLSYKSCLDKFSSICDITNEFSHSTSLASAYPTDVMPFTNYSFSFKGIIDYIFYSEKTMKVVGVLGPVPEEFLTQCNLVGCPNPLFPSDHFSLYAEFEMHPVVFPLANGLTGPR